MVDDDDEMYEHDPEEQIDTLVEDTREEDRVVTQDNPDNEKTDSEADEDSNQYDQVEAENDQSAEVEEEQVQEEPVKMGRKITAVVKLLRTQKEEDIIRILNQQSEPMIFLTQLQSKSEIRLVYTITQVTASLGYPPLRLDGKLVAFFDNYQETTTPTVMRAPDNIFNWTTVFLPKPERLTTERS